MKHRCGGELQPQKVKVKKKVGSYYQTFTVDGFKCDYCGEEIISRDTALAIDKTVEQLREVWNLRVPSDTKATTYITAHLIEAKTYADA